MSTGNHAELLQKSRDAVKATKGYQRITALFDEGTFNEVDAFAKSGDQPVGVVAGFGEVNGCPAYAFAQSSDVDGGAMSKAQASKIKKVYDFAVKTGAPVIGIYDSIGGCLGEGAEMLAAYGEILMTSNNLSGVVPQISVVLGPCIGTAAMIAAGADFVVMSEKGELTVHINGNDGSPEAASKLGLCHMETSDEESALAKVRDLVSLLPSNNLCGIPVMEAVEASVSASADSKDVKSIMDTIADAGILVTLSQGFGANAVTALCRVNGGTAGIISYQETVDAEACSKAARFLRFCDAFSIPVITLVDAQEFTSLREAAKLSNAYSEATTAKITVITGEAYGPVYIAVAGRGANADYTIAWNSAVVSPLPPQTAAIFLWSDRLAGSSNPTEDRKALIQEYKEKEATPLAAAADGLIEDVIAPEDMRSRIIANLTMLDGKRVPRLSKKHANIQM